MFVLAPDAISIVPSTPALSTIGVFAASDGDGEPVQYSIVASEMPGAFGIGASSGILSLQVPASDLMQNSSIFVAVGASDPNGARTDTVVRIDLTDSDSVAELFADGFED